MSVELLDKTRKINKLLHNNATTRFVFSDVCKVLSDTLVSNIIVLSKKGKILGLGESFPAVSSKDDWSKVKVGVFIDSQLNERLLGILSTQENINLETLGLKDENDMYSMIVLPIVTSGERLGTLLGYRMNQPYNIDDIIVAEYGNAVVGLEMLRSLGEEAAEELRKVQIVKSAINTLSASEIVATSAILKDMASNEGIIVASKLAENEGITRSVIVNSLRKLESAGIIESRSSGMKGTFISIKNDLIYEMIDKVIKGEVIQ